MTNDEAKAMGATSVFYWNYTCEADVIINQGGTSSGKTYAIMQVLLLKAIAEPNVVITVGGQDMPNLLAGSVRDTEEIVKNNKFIEYSFMCMKVMTDSCLDDDLLVTV